MRFDTHQHQFYCGIDLHARSMYLCVLKQDGEVLLHRNMPAAPEPFLKAVAPDREGLVVAVECIFPWEWLAALCAQEGMPCVLGHALYMKAIHGGKVKNDKIASQKIATLLRGGMLPKAYVYPAHLRATRDLLRRRTPLRRKRSELLSHVHHTTRQYHLPEIAKKIAYKANRDGVAERCEDASGQKTIEVALSLITYDDELRKARELLILQTANACAAPPPRPALTGETTILSQAFEWDGMRARHDVSVAQTHRQAALQSSQKWRWNLNTGVVQPRLVGTRIRKLRQDTRPIDDCAGTRKRKTNRSQGEVVS